MYKFKFLLSDIRTMARTQSSPAFYKVLSLKICDILHHVGVSQADRKEHEKVFTALEILGSLPIKSMAPLQCSTYFFGSSFEGTATDGMFPDTDMLFSFSGLGYICQDDKHLPDDAYLLMVQEEATAAGYAKLQLLQEKCRSVSQELYSFAICFGVETDNAGRSFVCNTGIKDTVIPLITGLQTVKHGPALTTGGPVKPRDAVLAFRCKEWPECAQEWLTRPRRYNWPSAALIDKMKQMGFFLVPVGHPDSTEQNKEWRISLSLQERSLMQSMNPVQFMCYVMLKLFKRNIIEPFVGVESLSSYHCKTCLFYMAENTPEDFWKPDNLLSCAVSCLEMISDWAEEGVCPNYFIPEENMFERRVKGHVRVKLCQILSQMLTSNCQFLLYIKTDGICKLIRSFCSKTSPHSPEEPVSEAKVVRKVNLHKYYANYVHKLVRMLLLDQYTNNASQLLEHMARLRDIKVVTEHSEAEIKDSVSLIVPYLELNLLTKLSAVAKSSAATDTLRDILFGRVWHDISLVTDCLTAKLKHATYLYAYGNERASLDVVQSVSSNCAHMLSYCVCIGSSPYGSMRVETPEVFYERKNEDMSRNKFMCKFWAPCVPFSAIEKDVIPEALVHELPLPGLPEEGAALPQLFYDRYAAFIGVDSKILLIFLLYLNHSRLGMEVVAEQDLLVLELFLEDDMLLGHRATGYNLLGWGYMQKQYRDKAAECFQISLALKGMKNAASKYLQDLYK